MQITMYSTRSCPYCIRARRLMDERKLNYRELRVDQDSGLRAEMVELSGRRTVPQIWIGETHVGGCVDLFQWERSGRLDAVLDAAAANEH